MARKMVMVAEDGSTPVLTEVEAHDEHQLQRRLTENPDLIPIEEWGWTGPLMVVGRETPLPSGAPDLIGIAPGGEILIAEFKTGPTNPDFRGALAQAIDYGTDLWGMDFEEFEATVAARYFASRHCPVGHAVKGCTSLIAAAEATWGDTWDAEDRDLLHERVAAALEAGRFHFAVIAQRFTPAMERTAAYLNSTTTGAGVYLVELIRFTDPGVRIDAFEARTVLRPERSRRSRSNTPGVLLDEESFTAREPNEDRRRWLAEFFEFCRGIGLTIEWGTGGVSIRVPTSDRPEPLSVGWLFPSAYSGWLGLTDLTLGFDHNSAEQTPSARPALDEYAAGLAVLAGAKQAKPKNLTAWTFDHAAAQANDSAVKDLLGSLVAEATRA